MNIDAWSPSTLSLVEGCMGPIRRYTSLGRATSTAYWSAAVTLSTVKAPKL